MYILVLYLHGLTFLLPFRLHKRTSCDLEKERGSSRSREKEREKRRDKDRMERFLVQIAVSTNKDSVGSYNLLEIFASILNYKISWRTKSFIDKRDIILKWEGVGQGLVPISHRVWCESISRYL